MHSSSAVSPAEIVEDEVKVRVTEGGWRTLNLTGFEILSSGKASLKAAHRTVSSASGSKRRVDLVRNTFASIIVTRSTISPDDEMYVSIAIGNHGRKELTCDQSAVPMSPQDIGWGVSTQSLAGQFHLNKNCFLVKSFMQQCYALKRWKDVPSKSSTLISSMANSYFGSPMLLWWK